MTKGSRISTILIVEDRRHDLVFTTEIARAAFGAVNLRTARTLAAARIELARFTPELVLLDLGLPDGTGSELIPDIRARHPNAWVVVLTVFDDDEHLFTALQRGADGYILKDESRTRAASILTDVLAGQPPLSARVARRVLKHFRDEPPTRSTSEVELTTREREILVFLSRGHTAGSVAAQLEISEHTVKTHIKNLYRKLDVSTRAGLVRTALDEGLA